MPTVLNNKKPWEYKWEIVNPLSAGGQGSTFLVKEKAGSELFVMKVLNNQTSPERRKRMRIEVLTNESISHPNIPRIIDSNVSEFSNPEIRLYCVSEFIDGGTLEQNLKEKSLSITEAVNFITPLIETIDYCHNLGIIHRDIKPDNIILRYGKWENPVLIDFGLTFNKEIDTENPNPTPQHQHLGNRFLLLPELRGAESNKRDSRSDITSIVGILFYLITNEYPTNLMDENSSKPHQRPNPKEIISKLDGEKQILLNRIFDKAFSISINERYQSLKALSDDLNELNMDKTEPGNIEEKLKMLRSISSEEKIKDARRLEANRDEVDKHLRIIIDSIHKELSDFTYEQSNYRIDYKNIEYGNTFRFINKIERAIDAKCQFRLYTNGSEELFEVTVGDNIQEIARRPIGGLFNWIKIKEIIREIVIDELYRKNSN